MVEVEEKFIEAAIAKYQISKFLEVELDKAGFSRAAIQRTPMLTRIEVEVINPGRVIGRKGKTIRELTEAIEGGLGIENPQISVVEVTKPELQPRLVAKRAAKLIEMGKKVRAVLHFLLRDIIRAGALGAEIVASGKIAAKGARSKSLRVSAGFIPKAGESTRLVMQDHVTAYPKSGAIGVLVRILPAGAKLPGREEVKGIELPKVIAQAEDVTEEKGPAVEVKKKEEKEEI